jgi:hypothetical protein
VIQQVKEPEQKVGSDWPRVVAYLRAVTLVKGRVKKVSAISYVGGIGPELWPAVGLSL